ncbi:MAG: hybrid sensor histidine kinase/response regulator [Chromatiales bacterium]|jgi:signal transduction histidine kinase
MNDLTITMGNLEEKRDDPALARDGTIADEYLRVLATQASRVPVPVFIAALIIASMAANHYAVLVWGSWLVIITTILLARWRILTGLPSKQEVSIDQRERIAVSLSLANGLAHGASLLFFPEFTLAERSIMTLILAGLMTGAVGTTAGHLKTYLAFTLPVIIPLAIAWGVTPIPDGNTLTQLGLPVLLLFFGAVLIGLAKEYSRFFIESFRIRNQQTEMNERLQAALEDAVSANQAKTRFLASASHDLRQPIHALSLFTGALMRRKHSAETTEILSHLNTAVENLSNQMSTLLDMSKLDAGIVEAHPAPYDLEACLEQLRLEFSAEAAEKKLDLELVGNQPAHVITDSEHFDRIMRNLLSNALRYTDEGGIRIELASDGNDWAITVRDTGRGIPEDEQQRIFDEFYQVDNPHRDRTQGLGLGLAIVKRLTSLLGIRIELASQEHVGTAITLKLPKHQYQETGSVENAAPVSLAGLRILCIDDEIEVRAALEALLKDMGCAVISAEGTEHAVAHARNDKPDILIADLRLAHGDDGIQAIRAVRAIHAGLPALLITGDTAPDRLHLVKETGITLLHKPVSSEELTHAIHRELHKQ